jgi:hypothetical protein
MKSHTQSIKTTLEEVDLAGREATIEFTRVTAFSHDPNADCDADGNRGVPRDEIDEDYAEDIMVTFDDCDEDFGGPTKVVPFDALHGGHRALVTIAVDSYIETHEPEFEEETERDWDVVNDERRDDADWWRSER